MPISIQADANDPAGYIVIDGQRVLSVSTTTGLSATLSPETIKQVVPYGYGFRNKIINGNFDVWQRGVSFASPTANTYTADRWLLNQFSGTTSSITRQTFDLGQTEVPNNPKYFLRLSVSGAGDIGISQRIEDVETLAGRQVTYSFWAKASAPTTIQTVFLIQNFGNTGSFSSPVITNAAPTNTTIGTSWRKVTRTVSLPSVLGLLKSTNDYLEFRIDIDQSFTGNFDIAQVQLEEGTIDSPFEGRPIGIELTLCQRYFESCNFVYRVSDASGNWGGGLPVFCKFAAIKRTANYSLVFYSGDSLTGTRNAINRNGVVQTIPAQITVGEASTNLLYARYLESLRIHNNTGLALTAGTYYIGSVTVDAEL